MAKSRKDRLPAEAPPEPAPLPAPPPVSARRAPRKAASGGDALPLRARLRPAGLGLTALGSAFVGVSLATFDPSDPSFFVAGSDVVHNRAGVAGAWIAAFLFNVFGYGAWTGLLPGVWAALRMAGRTGADGWTLFGRSLLVGTGITALALWVDPAGRAFPAGGIAGEVVAGHLRTFAGQVGAGIALLGAGLVGLAFGFHLNWDRIATRLASGVGEAVVRGGQAGVRAGSAVGSAAKGGSSAAYARIREQVAAWKEARAQEAADAEAEAERDVDSLPPSVPGVEVPLSAPNERGSTVWRGVVPPARPTWSAPPVDPTNHGARELVEVEWDPTHAGEPRSVAAAPAPRRAAAPAPSPAPRAIPPHRSADRDLGTSWDAPVPRNAPPAAAVEPELPVEDDDLALDAEGDASVAAPAVAPAVSPAPPRPPAPAPRPRPAAPSSLLPLQVDPAALVSGGASGTGVVVDARSDSFELPHLGLLDEHERSIAHVDEAALARQGAMLVDKLADFGITGEVSAIRPGPVITTFEYLPNAGIKLSKISALQDDIAMALKALSVRIVAPIPGKGVVGFEVPNDRRQTVWVRDMLACEPFRKTSMALPMVLGKNVEGKPELLDLAVAPHLLVAGMTGQGKSVGVNAMLLSMLYTRTPEELRLILIDPKMLEFELYRDIPHLLHPVVTEPDLANAALKWACTEMDERYRLLARWKTRNIASYNQRVEEELRNWTPAKARQYAPKDWPADEPPPLPKKLPMIVVVIDELADLMMLAAKEVEVSIARIAQKARAAGIHLIVATQRPEKDVVTGIIKANLPTRVAYTVRTRLDSRIILDQGGADSLLGKGDMLLLPPGSSELKRIHGPFATDDEVRRVTDFLRSQGPPNYEADIRVEAGEGGEIGEDEYDELYDQSVEYVLREGKASTSMIQRQFKIGYNRAARILEIMEREGLVGPADGARPRKVLVGDHANA